MRKFFGRAVLSAALIGWSGISYAEESSAPSCNDGDVTYESSKSDSCLYQSCQSDCDECLGSCLDNTVFFGGADIYKSVGDRVTNIAGGPGALSSSFGGVTGFNSGFGLGGSDLRGQIGASYGVYDLRGRLAIVPQATDVEEQVFVTAGVYQRGDMLNDCEPISFGLVVDAFHGNNWGVNANELDMGQVRGIAGYAINQCTEVGGFGSFHLWDDNAQVTVAGGGPRTEVRAANQLNAYIRRNAAFGGSLMTYAGAFDRRDVQAWQFGATGQAPLGCNLAVYGNFNYAVPSSRAGAGGSGEEQFNIQLGLAYYFGGKAVSKSVTGQQGLPLLNVANNGSFMITD